MATVAKIEVELDGFGAEQLNDGLLIEIANFFTMILKLVEATIRHLIGDIIRLSIEISPEYKAMLPGGPMYGQIGRPDIVTILQNIIKAIIDEVEVKVFMPAVSFDSVTAAMEISILNLDFEQVQRISGTYFDSENDFPVDWLNWLLFEGTRKVVLGYHYTTSGRARHISRTGEGIMGKYGSWSVPAEFAGTGGDNWLTRAMDRAEEAFILAIESQFEKAASVAASVA